MKYLFVLLFFVLGAFAAEAQQWKELKQAPIKLKYQIPQGWYVGGLMQGRACNCTGATINTAQDRSINMVIFSSNEVDLDSLKKQKIWGYSFAPPSANAEKLDTEFFKFEKALSTWNEDNESTVLRFAASTDDFRYLVYFWGNLSDISNNSNIIETILKSLRNI